jgi:hypothetical protein
MMAWPRPAGSAGLGSLSPVPRSRRHPLLVAVQPVADAIGASVVPATQVQTGDVELRWEGELVGGFRMASLDGALDRMIATVEREIGATAPELDREQKQELVRRLDELGAFTLRRSVEDVAEVLGVSRFTVYNYLNALQQD